MAKQNNHTNPIGYVSQSKTDAEGKERPMLIQQLTIRPLYRRSQDISTMLTAIRTAEAMVPRRTELYDMYADFLSSDAHLRSVYEKRIMGVTNIEWTYLDKNGQEVQWVTDWIDTPDFELVTSEMLKAKLWGYTMLELDFYADGTFGVYLIPRKHMRPSKGMISTEQTGDAGINIREGVYADTILEAGDETDLGLLMVAAQYVIFKRGSLSDWAQFAEVFGQPLIDAVWDGFDEDQRLSLLKALNDMGSGGQIVRPAGTELTFLQGGSNNPTGEIYKGIIGVCNDALSILLVGQTETTESSASSGQAQATVHAGTENDINKSDIKFVRRLLNKRLLKMLETQGLLEPGGKFLVKDQDQEDDPTVVSTKLNNDIRLKNEVGLPMSDDYFYETYGIEKPDDYDAQKEAMAAKKAADASALQMSLPDLLTKLRDAGLFLRAPKATGADIKASLKNLYLTDECCKHNTPKLIKLAGNKPVNDDFIKKVFNGELKDGQIHDGYYFDVAKKLSDAVAEGIGLKSFSVDNPQAKLFDKFKNNIYAFSAAKSLTMLSEYSKSLKDDKGEAVNYATFIDKTVQTDEEFNDVYLNTEYKSAVAMGQMGNKWTKLQQYDMLEYRTVGDSRVRKAHAVLDGTILPSNDPLWGKIYPPNDWNCRCTVIPAQGATQLNRDMAHQFSESPALKPYFKKNVGIDHVAFNEDEHPYFDKVKQFKTGVNKQVELMAEENYNMPSPETILSKKGLPEFTQAATEAEALEQWNGATKTAKSIDGLDWDFTDRWKHIVEDHSDQDRWKYINNTKDILENADEVWMTKQKEADGIIYTYKRYVKYYNGQPVVFSYPVENPDKWTMYSSKKDGTGKYKQLRDIARRGVLIKRK